MSCVFHFVSIALLSIQQQNMRENKEKQALGDLMIKPVQRIPRYELLVKVTPFKIELRAFYESY